LIVTLIVFGASARLGGLRFGKRTANAREETTANARE
jgi:hypothetical protein